MQVEQQALRKEKDPLSRKRFEEVGVELGALEDQLRPLQVTVNVLWHIYI